MPASMLLKRGGYAFALTGSNSANSTPPSSKQASADCSQVHAPPPSVAINVFPIVLLVTLSNKKVNRCCDRMDRISDLPCNIIDGILEHLNTRELVRTSILSRKWRYMWISVPRLEFDEDFLSRYEHLDDPGLEVSRIITQVLSLHNGPIYKFTLVISRRSNVTVTRDDLKRWILFLSSRGLKYLVLVNHASDPGRVPYDVFTCKELTYLKLGGFDMLGPPKLVELKSLRVLHFERVTFWLNAHQNIISGCPVLEELDFSFCYGFECMDHDDDFDRMDLSAPTVKVLRIEVDEEIESICLKKSNNVIDLTLLADRESVTGLIKSLPKMRSLTLESHHNKILFADMVPPSLLINSFSSLEYLKLTSVDLNDTGELLYIVSMIKSASNLVYLVIESYMDVDYTTQEVRDRLEELECISCCLSQLQLVDIIVKASSNHAMSLTQFILANSPLLVNLSFYVYGLSSNISDASMLLDISRELLLMERASQQAGVEFLYG